MITQSRATSHFYTQQDHFLITNLIRSTLTANIKNHDTDQRSHFFPSSKAKKQGAPHVQRDSYRWGGQCSPAASSGRRRGRRSARRREWSRPWPAAASGPRSGSPASPPSPSCGPPRLHLRVCAPAWALSVCVSEEEPSRRRKKKGRRRRGREEDGPTGTGPFAVIRLLKIVAFIALIFVLISV